MKTNSLLSHRNTEPESGVLYMVGTPIGNLNDISMRALNILKGVSLIACEDTRQTKKILNKFDIKNKLISFNKYNSSNKIPLIIESLKEGKSIALVSDAGMPGICDPGENLVKTAILNHLDAICIPGPSAVITALVSSGFPSSKFVFEGFLPRKKTEREKTLFEICKRDKTTILFESPNRLIRLLKELKEYLGGARGIQISRELTKKFEEHIGNSIDDALKFFEDKDVIGEITVVVEGVKKTTFNNKFDKFELKKELNDLTNAGLTLSAASKYLAKKSNLTKSEIYNMY